MAKPWEVNTGVYFIRNKVNGKVYVGSAAKSFSQRWNWHRSQLRRKIHPNKHLQGAWNKYGVGSFEFVIKVRCQPEDCLVREQYWIDRLDSADPRKGYNLCRKAGSVLGLRLTPEQLSTRAERRDEMAEFMSKESRRRWEDPDYRRKRLEGLRKQMTVEVRAKIAKTLSGRENLAMKDHWADENWRARQGAKIKEGKRKGRERRLREMEGNCSQRCLFET